MKRILTIKPTSSYDLLNYFLDTMLARFREHGIQIDIYDPSAKDALEQINLCKTIDYDMVLACNAMLQELSHLFVKNPDTIFWSFLVDHPYYHHKRLAPNSSNHIVSCIDQAHVQYTKKYYPHVKDALYLPHGGAIPSAPLKKYEDREYDVVILGSYTPSEILKSRFDQYPELVRMIVNQVIDTYFSTYSNTLEDLFTYYFDQYNLDLSPQEFSASLSELTAVDGYLRSKNRETLLNTLLSNHIKVDIFGSGWEKFTGENVDNLTIHPPVSYEESVNVMNNARIVINPLPLFTNGSHERVFTSMHCGAVCVSERNFYLEKEFVDSDSLCFYDMLHIDDLPESIHQLLSNPEKAKQIAAKGHELVSTKHTWADRADAILEYVKNQK